MAESVASCRLSQANFDKNEILPVFGVFHAVAIHLDGRQLISDELDQLGLRAFHQAPSVAGSGEFRHLIFTVFPAEMRIPFPAGQGESLAYLLGEIGLLAES